MDEIEVDGILRRMGSWEKPAGFVSSFPPTDAAASPIPIFSDDEIKEVLLDPGRRKSDILFPAEKWITDQRSTSACNGWATAGSLSRARFLRGIDDGFIGSGSFVYSRINGGQDNGSALEDGLKEIVANGTCSQSLCTADMIYPSQQPKSAVAEASKHKGAVAYHCPTKQAWRSACAAGFMGICAVHAGAKFSKFTKVNSGSPCTAHSGVDSGHGNHACTISDMRIIDGVEMFLLDNSWRPSWGSLGRTWLTWDSFEQTFGYHDFFVIPTTSESDTPIGATK